ncbi:hypothetical protein HYDPIDRAFT_188050 [Hydnomerulius pinastri MD-312]|uniref:Uncharacterized protein n=1 Tax=Hydnomerulius pinastri MD-312 TaxID=994086 RepID=A0A0C9W0M6_9AGAM|nr:hypothetical protein HYDPIDRAFT_188050 [Hydnomerulius pinastri MD-312]
MSLREQMQLGLIRLVPVLSSTASVTFAISEYQTLIPWLNQDLPPNHLSVWFSRWFKLGGMGVLAFGVASTWGGYAGMRGTVGGASALYKYGTYFALGHFAFAPPISQCIKRLVYGPTDAKKELKLWLKIHTVRTLMADIPAMLCFIGAFLHTV